MAIKEDLYFSAQHIVNGRPDLTIPGQVVADLSLWVERVGTSVIQDEGSGTVTIQERAQRRAWQRGSQQYLRLLLEKKGSPPAMYGRTSPEKMITPKLYFNITILRVAPKSPAASL